MVIKEYKYSSNYDYPLLAELYDKFENHNEDIQLLKKLIGAKKNLKILELFSGTGRILIPLIKDGHHITGIELAPSMHKRLIHKLNLLEESLKQKANLLIQDVLDGGWGEEYDLLIIGGNSFYELPSPDLQEKIIRFAIEALKPGGYLFIDNDDYKGNWGETEIGNKITVFEGNGEDGSYGKFTVEGIMYDSLNDILHMKRTWFTKAANGTESYMEYISSKHPVTKNEIEKWLHTYNFKILEVYGNWVGESYTEQSKRAIFWAVKPE